MKISAIGSRINRVNSLFLSILFSVTGVAGEEPLKPLQTDTPPVIDGKLDDTVWTRAPQVTGFKTFAPDFGTVVVEQTVVYMAYDTENLYFAYQCYEPHPEKIKRSISSRDNILSDDWVCINLDSFNDQQSLYALYINPLGIQADSRFAAGREDFSSDMIWYSAGKLDSSGYSVEVKVPLKSLRYSDRDPVEMSVFFERYISRRSEHSSYPAMDPAKGMAFLTQMKPMIYHGLKHYKLFELLPAATYSNKLKQSEGKRITDENKPDISLTGKYGITSDLILDGTLNPDFSQIESDAGQVDVNLRYALYYPEKRPFFLEGNENFTIAATQVSELDPVRSIVHTRTIAHPIAGLKLTGKLNNKTTIASIYAVDEIPSDQRSIFGNYAQVPILRIKSALSQDSYIGGIYAGSEKKDHFNRVAGVDEMFRLGKSSMLESHLLVSQTTTDSVNRNEWGHALGVSYWDMNRDLDYGVTLKNLSDNFSSETGYVSRTGILGATGILRPKFYPKSETIQRIDVELFTSATKDKSSQLWETFHHVSFQYFFLGSLTVKAKYSYSTEVFLRERFKTGGFQISGGGQFTKQLYLSVLYRRADAIYYSQDPYPGISNRITAGMIYQPVEKIKFQFDFVYSDFYRDADGEKIYQYPIYRGKLVYQLNKYLFFRGIGEYNDYYKELLTDLLASFTYIPGTVIHLGYGSLYNKVKWENGEYVEANRFLETKRGFFLKMSYLWRL